MSFMNGLCVYFFTLEQLKSFKYLVNLLNCIEKF